MPLQNKSILEIWESMLKKTNEKGHIFNDIGNADNESSLCYYCSVNVKEDRVASRF